jgi:hypothetical protein
MLNSSDFFQLSGKYQYVGKRKDENGVLMDVWITVKEGWPPSDHYGVEVTNYKTTLEWSFLASDWNDLSDEANTNLTDIPYHLYLKVDAFMNSVTGSAISWTYDYNIVDFTPAPPHWTDFDISLCYDQMKMAHFVIAFPGEHDEFVAEHISMVKDEVLWMVCALGQIETHLRVSNIELDFVPSNVTGKSSKVVTIFSILDVPDVKGDPDHIIQQKPLKTIASQLKAAVEGGAFQIEIEDKHGKHEPISAIKDSFIEIDERWDVRLRPGYGPKGPGIYTSGDMALISIGIVTLGILIGFIAGFFKFKDSKGELPVSFAFRKDTGHGDRVKIIDKKSYL